VRHETVGSWTDEDMWEDGLQMKSEVNGAEGVGIDRELAAAMYLYSVPFLSRFPSLRPAGHLPPNEHVQFPYQPERRMLVPVAGNSHWYLVPCQ
jgi:hypothetical protein